MKLRDVQQAFVPALLSMCIFFGFNESFAQSGLTSAPIGPSLTTPVAPAGPGAAPAQTAPAHEAAAAPSGALPNDEQRGAYEKAFQETLGKPSDPEALA